MRYRTNVPSLRRMLNLMRRLAEGETLYISGGTPRIAIREIVLIEDLLGTSLQRESLWGAQPGGPRVAYAIDKAAMKAAYLAIDMDALRDAYQVVLRKRETEHERTV